MGLLSLMRPPAYGGIPVIDSWYVPAFILPLRYGTVVPFNPIILFDRTGRKK